MAFEAITSSNAPSVSAFSAITESLSASASSFAGLETTSSSPIPISSRVELPSSSPTDPSTMGRSTSVSTNSSTSSAVRTPLPTPSPSHHKTSAGPIAAIVAGSFIATIFALLFALFLLRRYRRKRPQLNFEIINGKKEVMLGTHPAFQNEEADAPPIRFKSLNGRMVRVDNGNVQIAGWESSFAQTAAGSEPPPTSMTCERYE